MDRRLDLIVFPFSLARLAQLFLSDADICVFRHNVRSSVYQEADACKDRAETSLISSMLKWGVIEGEGLPDTVGLAELPVILRRHSSSVQRFNQAWWAEIASGSRRDQLSFDYVAWRLAVPYVNFPLSVNASNGLFVKLRRHVT